MITLTPKAPDTWGRVWLRSLISVYLLLEGASIIAPPLPMIGVLLFLVAIILGWSCLCSFWVETRLAIIGLIVALHPVVLMLFAVAVR